MPTSATNTEPIKIAVITGGHSFDVINFHRLFRELKGVDAYIQHMDDFFSSSESVRDSYDVALFYHMPEEGPSDTGRAYSALAHLGETPQGILLLHHAILAYPKWPVWSEIVGIRDRELTAYYHDQKLHIKVENANHPVTTGLLDWDMVDETYVMNDAGEDSEILLTVDHPQSMKTIAWTRSYKRARALCCTLGHDNQAWDEPNFRTVLTRGIQWTAGLTGS
jgi:hypothetical protein